MRTSACLLAAVLVSLAGAVSTQVITCSTMEDHIGGERENLTLHASGALSLMPEAHLALSDAGLAALCAAARGDVLYVGGVSPGVVWRIGDGGTRLLWQLDDGAVTALCVWGDEVVAAVAPSGRLVLVPEEEGEQPAELASLPSSYVFAMAVRGDELLCAAGDPAAVYAVAGDGEVRTLAKLAQGNALSLVVTPDGPVVSTEPDGLVILVPEGASPLVLFDAPEKEVRSLVLDREGFLLAATCEAGPPSMIGAGARPAAPTGAPEGPPEEGGDEGGDGEGEEGGEELKVAAPPPPPPPQAAGGAQQAAQRRPSVSAQPAGGPNSVYRISLDGRVEQLYSGSEAFYCATLAADGSLLLGGASRGQVYRLEADGRLTSLASLPVEQVVGLLPWGGGALVALCGNPGKVYRLGPGVCESGTYTSEPLEGGFQAAWGRVVWRAETPAGSSVDVDVRSGNAERPGPGWSEWVRVPKSGAVAGCPRARYIQYRLTLHAGRGGDSPTVEEVALYCAPQNRRPRLTNLTFGPGAPGGNNKKNQAASSAFSTEGVLSGEVRVSWSGSDPDDDVLRYSLWLLPEGADWLLLEDDIEEASFTWDTAGIPDGRYRLKVVATDEESNPVGEALFRELESEEFLVDNTPPALERLRARLREGAWQITGEARDEASGVAALEYSLDGSRWTGLPPADGVADGEREEISLDLGALAGGSHRVVLRAWDRAGNVGAGAVVF